MPLNAETDAVLRDLEAAGFDLSSVRQQATNNPLLEKAANSNLGGGILRRSEYVRFVENKNKEVETLQSQVRELAAVHDVVESLKDNQPLYEAALEKIDTLERNMIDAGWNPDEVKALSFHEKAGLSKAVQAAKQLDASSTKEREEPNVPENFDPSKYVTTDELQTVAANLVGGNIVSSLRMQHQIRQAEKLGIEVDDAKVAEFEKNLFTGLQQNKSYEQIADETFGLAAKREELRQQEQQKTIDSEVRKQVAEQLKSAGVSAQSTHITRPQSVMHQMRERYTAADAPKMEGEGGTKVIGGRQVPVNKFGDIEFHKLRGNRQERVDNAMKELEGLSERRPDLFEEVY